jgi:hypothetical protein
MSNIDKQHRSLDHGLDSTGVERPRHFLPTIFALHEVSRSRQLGADLAQAAALAGAGKPSPS